MVEWISLNRDDSTWEARVHVIRLTVHKYAGCGDLWFMTCHKFGVDIKDLKTDDLEMAKSTALVVFERCLKEEIEICQNTLAELRSGL
jgi:hypothetical protein